MSKEKWCESNVQFSDDVEVTGIGIDWDSLEK
jgi:hypothetical protein